MNVEPPNWEPPPSPPEETARRPRGRLRLLGFAVAIAVVGAAAGFVVTRAGSETLASTTAAKPSPSPSSSAHRPSFGRGGFGAPCGGGFASTGFGAGGGGFCGGETGTVTGINSATITLRTFAGTATISTNSSTKYSREGKQVSISAVKVGEILEVRGSRGATATSASSPITASAITIEVPTILGRVQSMSGDTITLVTGNGQLEYVTTSGSTAYLGFRSAAASSASVKAGIYLVAQGTETDLTHMTADGIQVLGSMSFAPHSFPGHSGTAPSPKASTSGSAV